MEINNTKKMTAQEIADTFRRDGYTYCGLKARVWTGKTQSRIYFNQDFVTIQDNGTIHNNRSGKPRALTIGDEAVIAIRNIMINKNN